MRDFNPLSLIFGITMIFMISACGETETNIIKWQDQKAGIKAWEKKTTNGVTTITHYYPSGMKMKQEDFDGLKRHGKSIKWYENGIIESEKTFEYGQKIGTHKSFYNNGQISSQKHFAQGQKNGVWSYYLVTGEQWRIETYDVGSLASAESFDIK